MQAELTGSQQDAEEEEQALQEEAIEMRVQWEHQEWQDVTKEKECLQEGGSEQVPNHLKPRRWEPQSHEDPVWDWVSWVSFCQHQQYEEATSWVKTQ